MLKKWRGREGELEQSTQAREDSVLPGSQENEGMGGDSLEKAGLSQKVSVSLAKVASEVRNVTRMGWPSSGRLQVQS